MRISDWSSDVCSSDLGQHVFGITVEIERVVLRLLRSVVIPGPDRGPGYDLSHRRGVSRRRHIEWIDLAIAARPGTEDGHVVDLRGTVAVNAAQMAVIGGGSYRKRSEEHTSELQSLMRISYAVFC